MNILKYDYKKKLKYPHLSFRDKEIWDKFIEQNPKYFDAVAYDAKVGTPRSYTKAKNDRYKKDLQILSQKRIDVIGFKDGEIFIIEIKPSASLSAIGQIVSLFCLFQKEYKGKEKIRKMIITDFEIPDMKNLTKENEIKYKKVK